MEDKYTGLLKIPKYFADFQAFSKLDYSAKKKSKDQIEIEQTPQKPQHINKI